VESLSWRDGVLLFSAIIFAVDHKKQERIRVL